MLTREVKMKPTDLIETLNIWKAKFQVRLKDWDEDDEAIFKILMDILTTNWVEDFLNVIENIKNEEG